MSTAFLKQGHLTGIEPLSIAEIEAFLDKANDYADRLNQAPFQSDILKGKTILSLFMESSTRTLTSFEMAAKRLGGQFIKWDSGNSALNKGEGFGDTVLCLDAMRPDAIIIRHHEYGAADFVAKHVNCPVINAGDSWHEHPTQALLDALTIRRNKGTIEGLNIAICGDVAHSRVANSNMILLTRMGADIRVIAPPALMPEKFPADGIGKFTNMEDGLKDCDIVMTLRLQKERMEDGLIESDAAFFNQYGLTPERLALARPGAMVMHPGPMNRGVEIADEVADDPVRSLIFEQARNGVPTRMAVLDLLLGEKE